MFHRGNTPQSRIMSSLFGCAFEQTKAVRVMINLQSNVSANWRSTCGIVCPSISNLVISLLAPRDYPWKYADHVQFDFSKTPVHALMLMLNTDADALLAKGAG